MHRHAKLVICLAGLSCVKEVTTYAFLAAQGERTSQCTRLWLRGRRLLPRWRCGCPRPGRLPSLLLSMPTLQPSLQAKPNIWVMSMHHSRGPCSHSLSRALDFSARREDCHLGFGLSRRPVMRACPRCSMLKDMTNPSITLQGSSPGRWPGTLRAGSCPRCLPASCSSPLSFGDQPGSVHIKAIYHTPHPPPG